ncbi:MAG: tetratricopeptide repeat protein [Rhizobium sp.]|nr:MAG: tetratricopeptide repeat protein [Rhizobium sp.]
MNIHLGRAELLLRQQRYELAEEQLRLALAEGTETAKAHALLALCLLERDRFEEATQEAEQAIHDAPDEALGFYALASVQWKRNRLKEAESSIREAIRLEPWDADYFCVLAGIEGDRYQWHEALESAEQGLACDPDHVGCNNLRAIALVNLGRKGEAGQSIEATLAKNPEDAVSHANQGWTLLHQQQPREAMTHFREALRLEPNLEWARLGIIEAMKARFFVYRWLLTFFLWLSRFSPQVQMALMVGLVFGRGVLANLLRGIPALEPLAVPLSVAYMLFVWMTWTASALFNLVLRLDPFGRLVLNSKERLESTLVGLCLVLCLLIEATVFVFPSQLSFVPGRTGLLYLGLMLPLIATFRQGGKRQKLFAAYSSGVAVCIVVTTYLSLSFCWQVSTLDVPLDQAPEKVAALKSLATASLQWFDYSVWGIVISTWIGAGLSLSPVRR